MWSGIIRSWLDRRSTFSDCGNRDTFALKLRMADFLMASKIMTVGQGKVKQWEPIVDIESVTTYNRLLFHCSNLLPVLRFELAFIAVELRRNATFLLFVPSPTILCLIKLSTLATLVKAYLCFLVKSLWIRIRNVLIRSRLALLLLHQLKHHETSKLFWNERERQNVNKRKSHDESRFDES